MTLTRWLSTLLYYIVLVDPGVQATELTHGASLRGTVPSMDTSKRTLLEEPTDETGVVEERSEETESAEENGDKPAEEKSEETGSDEDIPKISGGDATAIIILFVVNGVLSCCIACFCCRCCFHCFRWIGKMICVGVSKKSRQAWLEEQLLQLPPISKDGSSPTVESTVDDDIEIELDDDDDDVVYEKNEKVEDELPVTLSA
ncbi:hypothetical protein FOZ63_029954 [Perkinsus olseni]|uniref:Uncharacterized protein n=1 Tax=Perkinsus olseni TaxID=32597 RepID=A0A7J6REM1_PEROL|nr:hypothetical protein FOZ63_029954 [Perkinsus olseni]